MRSCEQHVQATSSERSLPRARIRHRQRLISMRHPTKVQSLAGSFDLRVATKIGRTMQRGLGDIAADCPRLCRSIIDVDVEAIVRRHFLIHPRSGYQANEMGFGVLATPFRPSLCVPLSSKRAFGSACTFKSKRHENRWRNGGLRRGQNLW